MTSSMVASNPAVQDLVGDRLREQERLLQDQLICWAQRLQVRAAAIDAFEQDWP